MNPEIIAAWFGVGASAVIGGVGWILAGLANSKAEKANKIAKDALAEAVKANEIAEDANQLSEDANTLVKRQALQQSDPSHVDWAADWDQERLELILTNTGRDTALNVSVLIKGKQVDRLSDRHGDVPRGEKVVVAFPEFADQRREHSIAERDRVARYAAADIFSAYRPWRRILTIDVRWLYQSRKPGAQVIEQRVS